MIFRRRRLIDRILGEPEYEREYRREELRRLPLDIAIARPLPGYEYLRSKYIK